VKFINTNVAACFTAVEMSRHFDSRGFFQEIYNQEKYWPLPMHEVGWRQVNWSNSTKDVLRGLHVAPYAKLVTCVKGRIYDVVVDMRESSPSYKKWFATILDGDHPSQVFVPPYCGHGFVVFEDASVIYLQSDVYEAGKERTVRWDDPEIGIMWPVINPVLSDKDASADYIRGK
jgi:dTDP-4-dehydrorhamnose 3,5-epimerase